MVPAVETMLAGGPYAFEGGDVDGAKCSLSVDVDGEQVFTSRVGDAHITPEHDALGELLRVLP